MSMLAPMYGLVAALLTRMSTAPKASMVACTAASAWSGSPAFAAKTATSPSLPMPAFTASSASCLRDDSITCAPAFANVSAMDRPMPLDAPVTSATLPSSEISTAADRRRLSVGLGGDGRGAQDAARGIDQRDLHHLPLRAVDRGGVRARRA